MVSEAATLEAVKRGRALGDPAPITKETLWHRVGEDMAAKPYKALGIDLLQGAREGREAAIDAFIAQSHLLQTLEADGRNVGREMRQRQQADAVKASLPRHIASLDEALRQNLTTAGPRAAEDHLRRLRVEAEVARRKLDEIASPVSRLVHPRSSPSAGT